MFSAILIGHLLRGEPLKQSTRAAMDALSRLIEANKDNEDKNRGIPVEKFLHMLDC
jgi:pyridoxine kinase